MRQTHNQEELGSAPVPREARNRRSRIARGAVAAGLGLSMLALAACSGGSSATESTAAAGSTAASAASSGAADAGSPVSGGTLRVGASGGSNTDTLDANNALTNPDFARLSQLYDPLVRLDATGQVEYRLADSITPNADATSWTIKLKPGITTHSGKPLTAKDVLSTFNRIMDNKLPLSVNLGTIDLANAKVVDDTTLEVPFSEPNALFVDTLASPYAYIVPEGYDPAAPDGTGPFMYKSFTPGVESTFVKNPNYWDTGKPYLDSIVTTNIADETSQVSALQAGQVDVITFLSATSVNTLKSAGYNVTVSKTGAWAPFTMRTDTAPFDDPKVREAFRLLVNRDQMNQQVYGGLGTVGNDMIGIYSAGYPKDLPQREQDIEKAKQLLAEAGKSNLSVDLITTANAPGQVLAAQVFATQAKEAGVTVNVIEQSPTDYFAKSYLKVPFSQDYWPMYLYPTAVGQGQAGPSSPYNATAFNDPEYNELYKQAQQNTDPAARDEIYNKMMKIEYERGGNIIPYFFPVIDAAATSVQGIAPAVNGMSPGGNYWTEFWIKQ